MYILQTGELIVSLKPRANGRNIVGYKLRLDPFAQLFQHCWGHTRSLRMDYKDLWVVFFPRCTVGSKLVGSRCIRLHTTANTHATTPNIVAPTMLGVVSPVCTQPQSFIITFCYHVKFP